MFSNLALRLTETLERQKIVVDEVLTEISGSKTAGLSEEMM